MEEQYSAELAQMKRQIELLRKKVNEEFAINEEYLRKAITSELVTFDQRHPIWSVLIVLSTTSLIVWASYYIGYSIWLCGVFCLFMAGGMIYNHISNRHWKRDLANDSMLELLRKIERNKRNNTLYYRYSLPFKAAFYLWLLVEMYFTVGLRATIVLIVLLPSMLRRGYKNYRKLQEKLDNVHNRINEFVDRTNEVDKEPS